MTRLLRSLVAALALAVAALAIGTARAEAAGGNYVFQGGTPAEQSQVRQALAASSFNWSVVPGQITIEIAPTPASEAIPGKIFLDPDLLDSGEFSWGVVQHEYAHQVDFALFNDTIHAQLNTLLGGTAWCYGDASVLQHNQYGCERFASTLAWAYWQSPQNCMKPSAVSGESAAMAPAAFRALMTSLLGAGTQSQSTAAAQSGVALAEATTASTPLIAASTKVAKLNSSSRGYAPPSSAKAKPARLLTAASKKRTKP
jgi:hypothetical protein